MTILSTDINSLVILHDLHYTIIFLSDTINSFFHIQIKKKKRIKKSTENYFSQMRQQLLY